MRDMSHGATKGGFDFKFHIYFFNLVTKVAKRNILDNP